MKQLLLLFLFSCCAFVQLDAQICEPNQMYADSAFGIYPPPYDETTMTGGIDQSACINAPYYFAFTFRIPETIDVPNPPVTAQVISIQVDSFVNAPVGLALACNPPSCLFTPEDILGCAAIYGTATSDNLPGEYELTLAGTIETNILTLSFEQLFAVLGTDNYELTLEAENSGSCFVSVQEPFNDHMSIETAPNPFMGRTNITITSDVNETLQFHVVNLLGELIHTETIQVNDGENVIEFDGSHLANGIYQFTFSNGETALSQKVVLQK